MHIYEAARRAKSDIYYPLIEKGDIKDESSAMSYAGVEREPTDADDNNPHRVRISPAAQSSITTNTVYYLHACMHDEIEDPIQRPDM
jgi:hypothetical protein